MTANWFEEAVRDGEERSSLGRNMQDKRKFVKYEILKSLNWVGFETVVTHLNVWGGNRLYKIRENGISSSWKSIFINNCWKRLFDWKEFYPGTSDGLVEK